MTDRRETNELEIVGERLLQVCRGHAEDKEPSLSMLAAFAWAWGGYVDVSLQRILPRPMLAADIGLEATSE